MVNLSMKKKYSAYTLLEMLLVLGIMVVIGGVGTSSFMGLHNTVKMNEYTMTLEQDIRRIQRASMLLERNPMENWLYGIGIDFSRMASGEGDYRVFKWCTPFPDYGDITTTSKVPAFDPNAIPPSLDSAALPTTSEPKGNICGSNIAFDDKTQLRILPGYERSITIPRSNITFEIGNDARYVIFESISGRAFFYDEGGNLLNYKINEDGRLVIEDAENIKDLVFKITPIAMGPTPRQITIKHLSGRVLNQVVGRNE